MPSIKIKQGDCVESLAAEHGLDPKVVWHHSENAKLRDERDPNALHPGDSLFLPEKDPQSVAGATETRHRFVRKGVPTRLKLKLLDEEGEPLAGWDYTLNLDDQVLTGQVSGSGVIDVEMPPHVTEANLVLEKDDESIEWPLDIGSLDPLAEVSGAQARLNNLGFDCESTGELDEQTLEALHAFQASEEIPLTDELDDETRTRLEEVHDESEMGL